MSPTKPVERVKAPKGDRFLTEAGERFDAVMAIFRNGWAEAYPSEPFSVDGVITPRAMEYIRGYCDGLRSSEGSEGPEGIGPGGGLVLSVL